MENDDIYTYLKSIDGKLYFSNQKDGNYEEVGEHTITSDGVPGQKVIFQCEGGIESISAITREPESPKVFTDEGVKRINSTCWSGTIRKLDELTSEKYSITWVDSDGQKITLDPCANGHN